MNGKASFFMNDEGDNKMLMLRADFHFDGQRNVWVATCEGISYSHEDKQKAVLGVFAEYLDGV